MTSIPPPGYEEPADTPQPAEPQPGEATQQPRPVGQAGWRPWTAWAAILTGFGLVVFAGLIVAIVSAAIGAPVEDPSPGVNIGLTMFQNLALLAAALLFAHLAGRPLGGDFGLSRPRIGQSIRLMFGVMFAFYVFSLVWGTTLNLDERQTLPDELGIQGSTLNLVLVIVMITVVAPVGEELFFRGYFFAALRNWRGWFPAAILTALVFGAVHIGSSPIGFVVPLAAFGFGLCWLYQRTGSLYPCIALHALNNSVALGFTQEWTWEIAPLMVGSLIASLAVARLLARGLAARAPSVVAPAT